MNHKFIKLPLIGGHKLQTEKSVYSAPHVVVHSVLQGTFNFATMPTHLIRAIVWTLAYCQPKNNDER